MMEEDTDKDEDEHGKYSLLLHFILLLLQVHFLLNRIITTC